MMVFSQELKESILFAAMSGKLTTQFPDCETAEKISSAVNQRNSIVKKKSLEVPGSEIPFEIPSNWKWLRLGAITENLSDGIHGTPVFDNAGDYYFINGNNLVHGQIQIKSDTQRVTKAEYLKYKKPLTTNTILLSINGTIGNVAYYNEEPVILGKSACYIALYPEINRQYIGMILRTSFFLSYGRTKATQTTIKNLSLKAMRLLPVPVPPIEEQQRIVDRVNELLAKADEFEKIEQQLITLKASFPGDMRAAILQAAMQGKLTEQLETDSPIEELLEHIDADRTALIAAHEYKPNKKLRPLSDEEFPFDVPESWTWLQLGYCSTYGQTKAKATQEDIQSDVWSLDLEDIEKVSGKVIAKVRAKDRPINGDKIKFCKGNILYSKLRPYLLKILIADEDGICSPELIPFEMMGGINPRYILWVLRSPHIDYTINSVTYGVKMPRVGTETMINLLIPLPPIEEQQRIVERLDKLLPLCDELVE